MSAPWNFARFLPLAERLRVVERLPDTPEALRLERNTH